MMNFEFKDRHQSNKPLVKTSLLTGQKRNVREDKTGHEGEERGSKQESGGHRREWRMELKFSVFKDLKKWKENPL